MVNATPISTRTRQTALVNPSAGRRARRPHKVSGAPRRKSNPGETVLLGFLNPQPEKKPVSIKKKEHKPRRKNPVTAVAVKKHQPMQKHYAKAKGRRRHNPVTLGALSKPIEMMKLGAIAALAFFTVRQVPQIALKTRNTSWLGYLANFLTALGCAAGAGRLFGPVGGQAALVGGSMYLFSRFLNDVSPLGKTLNLSGVGDPHAAALGGLVPAYWASPPVTDRTGRVIPPQALIDAVIRRLPAPQPGAMPVPVAAGTVGRFSPRF